MSILDDQKRARRGAKALLRLLEEKKNFDENLDAYTAADGIIDADFLPTLDRARLLLKEFDAEDFLTKTASLPLAFQEAFMQFIISRERYDLLARVRDTSANKDVVKSVKQHLHALKSKGVHVPEQKQKGWKHAIEDEKTRTPNLVTSFDYHGYRMIFFSQDQPAGIRAMHVIERDTEGISVRAGFTVEAQGYDQGNS